MLDLRHTVHTSIVQYTDEVILRAQNCLWREVIGMIVAVAKRQVCSTSIA
jgi:hypothetical protein